LFVQLFVLDHMSDPGFHAKKVEAALKRLRLGCHRHRYLVILVSRADSRWELNDDRPTMIHQPRQQASNVVSQGRVLVRPFFLNSAYCLLTSKLKQSERDSRMRSYGKGLFLLGPRAGIELASPCPDSHNTYIPRSLSINDVTPLGRHQHSAQ
jgi:hypothetical protein